MGVVGFVSRVGGLVDTVRDADEDASGGTGIMCAPTAEGLRDALDRALKLYGNRPRYAAVQRRGMMRDFSWKTAATAFEALYIDSL